MHRAFPASGEALHAPFRAHGKEGAGTLSPADSPAICHRVFSRHAQQWAATRQSSPSLSVSELFALGRGRGARPSGETRPVTVLSLAADEGGRRPPRPTRRGVSRIIGGLWQRTGPSAHALGLTLTTVSIPSLPAASRRTLGPACDVQGRAERMYVQASRRCWTKRTDAGQNPQMRERRGRRRQG
jgi:hypothetical protein